jgi:hypothetical protein
MEIRIIRINLSCCRDVELLEEVVHDEDGDDDGDEDRVGEADDEDGPDHVVQLNQQKPEVHRHRDVDDVLNKNIKKLNCT